jgi:hypothetical protein
MEGMWRKAKKALGIGLCAHLPVVAGDREDCASERRASDAFSQDSAALAAAHASAPNTPAQAEAGALLRRSKSGAKSSKVRPFSPSPRPSPSSHYELRFVIGLLAGGY